MPIAVTIASSEMRLNEKPQSWYRIGDAASAIGTARMTENAVFGFPIKRRTMIATTISVIHSSLNVLLTEALMAPVESLL